MRMVLFCSSEIVPTQIAYTLMGCAITRRPWLLIPAFVGSNFTNPGGSLLLGFRHLLFLVLPARLAPEAEDDEAAEEKVRVAADAPWLSGLTGKIFFTLHRRRARER